jgi:serine/threonine-protein kinase
VFYRLLTGALPFRAETAIAMVQKQLAEPPMPLRAHRGDLPAWCDELIQRALAKSPGDRFQTAEAFRAALAVAAGLTAADRARPLPPPSPPEQTTPAAAPAFPTPSGAPPIPPDGATIVIAPPQRARRRRPAMAAVALAAVAAGVVAMRRPVQTMPAPPPAPAVPLAAAFAPADVPPDVHLVAGAASRIVEGAPLPAAAATVTAAPLPPPSPATLAALRLPAADALIGSPVAPAPVSSGVTPVATALVPLAFDARTLVREGERWSEREATLFLADQVTLTANNTLLQSIPYAAVRGLTYSQGRQPMVAGLHGAEPVVPVDGSAFGFLRSPRHWITLHTGAGFVVIRVDDDRLNPVLQALTERTGRRVDRVVAK